MRRRSLCNILLALMLSVAAYAHNDSIRIYQGTQIKLDIASPIIVPALNQWKIQHYELAVNVRLKDRFYPTFEAGYATPGGFFRVGADINPLKKHPESPHALLVGLRIGSGYQVKKADCWGEIVAGCQVNIAAGFYMGWMGRFKFLFTRATEDADGNAYPTYIPGYGTRDNIGWGVNYYLGYKF